MANPFFNALRGPVMPPQNNILQQAMKMRQMIANPKAEVDRLVSSGQMSPEQLENLKAAAQQYAGLFR